MNRAQQPATIKLSKAVLVASAAVSLLSFSCQFFPASGPYSGPSLRATPGGVITQLLNAYSSRDITLYQDLFPVAPHDSFQFYVAQPFVSTFLTEFPNAIAEPRDTSLIYLTGSSVYYYWTQDIEMSKTQALFNKAVWIQVFIQPTVDPANFHYFIDSLGDTTKVEVLMTDGEIDFLFPDDDDITPVDPERQDFLLERDKNHLWVIRKWYDLGTQP